MRSLLGALLRGGCDDDEDVVSMGGSREEGNMRGHVVSLMSCLPLR